ncbi:MAG: coproporphyrinogen III oxidase family protein, partial [Bdellovibrio sp.]
TSATLVGGVVLLEEGLRRDVKIAIEQGAKHLSPYCLTVPDGHPLAKGRPIEDEQVEMFDLIAAELSASGFQQYEISNFSLPGHESRHNLLYWTDEPYWGLGLSAHSYSKESAWGTRYWNINSIGEYQKQVLHHGEREFTSPSHHLPENQFEVLEMHQALTDFCHTSLRLMRGLNMENLAQKFPTHAQEMVTSLLEKLEKKAWLRYDNKHWSLTREGVVLSNQIFQELTFLKSDIN